MLLISTELIRTTRQHATYLAAHNDVLAVIVYDPLGIRLPVEGRMEATDGERQITVPNDSQFERRFEAAFRDQTDALREKLGAIRIPILPICTHDPVKEQVLAALGKRK